MGSKEQNSHPAKMILSIALGVVILFITTPCFSWGDSGIVNSKVQVANSQRYSQTFHAVCDGDGTDDIVILVDPSQVGTSHLYVTGIRTNLTGAGEVYYIFGLASPAEGIHDGVICHMGSYAAKGGESVDVVSWLHHPRDGSIPLLITSGAGAAGGTTVVCATAADSLTYNYLGQDDDFWNGGYVKIWTQTATSANNFVRRSVTDFVDSTDTITVSAFPAQVATATEFSIEAPDGLGLYGYMVDASSAYNVMITIDYVIGRR